MSMNPRLLKPTASGFTPRSISGLALWLDASDGDTLFQNSDGTVPATATSDPVGYWGDKSGNGRHAVQAVSANRPTVGSSSTAGKNAVRNNGTGSVALQVAAWPYTAGNTQFAVFNASALNQAVAQRGTLNDEPRFAIQSPASGVVSVNATRGGSSAAQTSSTVGYPTSQWAIGATLFNTALGRAYRDGVYGADTTDSQTFSGDQELRILSLPGNIYGINGGIAEFLYYDRQLTATEVSRVAAYLSRRWGITLAPTVANADAQNWVDRVYANGGTVSSATAAAVNTFCEAIASAGIRDRFYRMGIFAGSNLNAALVPLYRGPSLGGTQYGGTTDTNNAFVGIGTDYAETGATGGLTGNGTTKYLNTGFNVNNLTATSFHLSSFIMGTQSITTAKALVGALFNGVSDRYRIFLNATATPASTYSVLSELGKITNVSASLANGNAGLMLTSRTTASSLTLYDDGVSINTNPASTAEEVSATPLLVFARTGPVEYYNGTMGAYSIGAGLDATQAAAYSAAMNAFQTALGRV